MRFARCPNKEATIEEANIEEITENEEENYRIGNNKPSIVKNLGRMEIGTRSSDIKKVLEYNILKRKSDENIQAWKSYPGISRIIQIARNIIEKNDITNIGELANP